MTAALLLANGVVFALEVALGGSARPDVLVGMGAMVPRLIVEYEQSWRLVSASFLHIGVAHFLVNAVALLILGRMAERYYGARRFLVLYVLSGLGGALASFQLGQAHISAGASGAIFGLVGAGIALWIRHGPTLDKASPDLRNLAWVLLAVTGANLGYGFLQEGVDAWNHLGGLGAGLVCALLLDPANTSSRLAEAAVTTLFVASISLLGFTAWAAATNPVDAADPVADELLDYFNNDTLDYRRGYRLMADLADGIVNEPPHRRRHRVRRELLPLTTELLAELQRVEPVAPDVRRLHIELVTQARDFQAALKLLESGRTTQAQEHLTRARHGLTTWRARVASTARGRGYNFDL